MEKSSLLRNNTYQCLPLGSIKPKGWLKKQLRRQADGLTGHLDEFWDDLGPDNKWLGGSREGWERGPYYADGLLPLAYLLDNDKLKQKAMIWVEAFLNYQSKDGWVGPISPGFETTNWLDPWPIFVVFKVLTQYYDVSNDPRVIDTMAGFFRYLERNLGKTSLASWAKFRWMELSLSLNWFYERTGEEWVLDVAEKIASLGYDWTSHFADFKYKQKDLTIKMETHVVNNAMGIKAPAVRYRQTMNEQDKKAVYQGIENLDKFHGQVTGVFSGDEHLSGKNPSQGTELCAVTEYMFSLETLFSTLGDPAFADRLERIAFNALPATFKPDMWAHQYDQQANQVLCTVSDKDWTNGPDANIFGLEPHFGCCTANMHQGWPKFASSLWMKQEGGLVAVAYSPCEIAFSDDLGQEVTIVEETDYPFSDRVRFTVSVAEPTNFKVSLRIPKWTEEAKVTLPDKSEVEPVAGEFLHIERQWNDQDTFEIVLPMKVEATRRYHGAVAIQRGPLVYSLPIEEEWQLCGGTPPHGDWEVFPLSAWNYGLCIDLNKLAAIQVESSPLPENPFSPGGAPLRLKATGTLVPEWKLEGNRAGEIPHSPCEIKGHSKELTLVPYGCTNLRITEFPLIIMDEE